MGGERYRVPAARHRAEIVVRRSRFLCTLGPAPSIEEAERFVAAVRSEFPDATHHCFAFVVGPPGSTARIGRSDAGEPRGTAGPPILNALLRSGVGDVAAVVTRWFGGVKLGTGGLVRAYGDAVREALRALPLEERVRRARVRIEVSWSHVEPLRRVLAAHGARVVEELYGESVELCVEVPADELETLESRVREATSDAARWLREGTAGDGG